MTEMIEKYDGRQSGIDGVQHEVIGRVVGRPAVQLKSPEGVVHEISDIDFRLQISRGNVAPDEQASASGRYISIEERLNAQFRSEVIKMAERLRQDGFNWEERIILMRKHFLADLRFAKHAERFPGVRAIQKWIKAHREQGDVGLEDGRYRSGNRTTRNDALFEEIVLDILEEQYLRTDRKTAKAVWRDARAVCLERCANYDIEPQPHGQKVVDRIIRSLPHADVVKTRVGGHEAKMRLLQAGHFARVERPFERVEMDSTQVDLFIVVDDKGTVSRPWVCAAIDCATGMCVGMQLSLKEPASVLTVQTLKEMMLPKSDGFFDKFEIENRFPYYVRPMDVVTDQGSENSGDVIESAVKAALFELNPNLPGTPQGKPFIERFFRTLNMFLTTLPGATVTSEMKGKDRTKKGDERGAAHISGV